jgi:signal transduction histidine kinase
MPERGSIASRLASSIRSPIVFVDVALALALVFIAGSDRGVNPEDRFATVVFVALPLLGRRTWPIPVLAVVGAAVVLTEAHGGWVDVIAVAVASFTVGDQTDDRFVSPVSVLAVALAMGIGFTIRTSEPALSVSLPLVIIVPSWVVGTLFRQRRVDAAARVAEEALHLRERESALRATVAEERRHIARELHDIVAHAVSVMVIQAGAARSVLHSSPADAETSLLAVESTGRDAMTELRRLLGVLGDEDDAGGLAPQAGVGQLPTLVQRVADAGLPVELHVEGEARALPPAVDVTLYRIAQEALTNALRYAGRARTEVRLTYEAARVRLEVLDEGAAAPPRDESTPGRGLVGMQERAALFGGQLDAGPRLERGFAVRAWLPIDPTPAPVA